MGEVKEIKFTNSKNEIGPWMSVEPYLCYYLCPNKLSFLSLSINGLLEMRLRLPTFYLGSLKSSKNIFLGSSHDWQQINEQTKKSFSFVSIIAF